jgi:hypothetical protein
LGVCDRGVRVPHFCTNARLTGSLGMVLNDGPERS